MPAVAEKQARWLMGCECGATVKTARMSKNEHSFIWSEICRFMAFDKPSTAAVKSGRVRIRR
jgi:hypothetical protein